MYTCAHIHINRCNSIFFCAAPCFACILVHVNFHFHFPRQPKTLDTRRDRFRTFLSSEDESCFQSSKGSVNNFMEIYKT